MSDTETIIKYLKLYNEWRRGDEKMGQPNPTEIGKLIDEACEMLTLLQCERDEAREKAERYRLEANAMMMQRDEAREELEEYRSIAENIGAKKAVSEKEKAIKERDEWKNKAYSHATDYTLMEAKCFRLEQQLKEYDQLKS